MQRVGHCGLLQHLWLVVGLLVRPLWHQLALESLLLLLLLCPAADEYR